MAKRGMKEITVLEFVRSGILQNGYAPSVREISESLGYQSTSTVQYYLDRLVKDGKLCREPGISRSLRLPPEVNIFEIPIEGETGMLYFCLSAEYDRTKLLARRAGENTFRIFLSEKQIATVSYE